LARTIVLRDSNGAYNLSSAKLKIGWQTTQHKTTTNLKDRRQYDRVITLTISAVETIRLEGSTSTKLVGSHDLAPLALVLPPDDESPSGDTDVSRVGARVAVDYQTRDGLQEFRGTVVSELPHWDKVEASWDGSGGAHWANEAVDWGACRILVPPEYGSLAASSLSPPTSPS
jgi:hypothetical protein